MKSKKVITARQLTGMSLFAALSYGVTFLFRIPVSFLTFDAKDAVLTVASFIYGPVSALFMCLIPALIEFISISDTGFWGLFMNYVSSACFAFTASLIYKYKRNFSGAIIGLYVAVAATTGVMVLMNILITPIYMKVPQEMVIDLLPKLLFPFNLAKTLMNAAIAMLIYKPISLALKKAKLIEGKMDFSFNKNTLIMLVTCGITLAFAIVIFVILTWG